MVSPDHTKTMPNLLRILWSCLNNAPNQRIILYFRSIIARYFLGQSSRSVILMQGLRFSNPRQIYISHSTQVSLDCFLAAGSSDNERLLIGSNVFVGLRAYIDATDGGISIGDDVLIGPNVVIRASNHIFADPHRPIRLQGTTGLGIIIESDVWLGANVVVVDGVTIGKGSVIGAGAVVTKSIPPYSVAVGVPAKVVSVRSNTDSHKIS